MSTCKLSSAIFLLSRKGFIALTAYYSTRMKIMTIFLDNNTFLSLDLKYYSLWIFHRYQRIR